MNPTYVGEKNPYRWVMLGFVCLFYFIILGFTNQSFNILLATMTKDMGWTNVQRTAIAGAMSTGMIWFVFVAGMFMDKFSIKRVYGSAVLICGVLTALRGEAEGFMFFWLLMFFFGVASAFYMPASTKIISLWFGKDELYFANGCLTAASPIGQITANFFAVQLMMKVGGWKAMYMIIGIAITVLAIAFFVFGKNRSSLDAALGSDIITEEDVGLWKNVKGILKVPEVWMYCLANMFFLGAIYAGGAYGQLILQTDPGWMLDKSISGRVPAMNNMTSMCAYILVPLIIRKIGNQHYRKAAIISGIIAPLLFAYGYGSYDFVTVSVCLALGGIFYGAIVPAPKVLMLRLPEVSGIRAGTALGVYTTIERIGITLFISVLGTMISAEGVSMASVYSKFWFIQLIAPVLIFIAGISTKKKLEKLAQAKANA